MPSFHRRQLLMTTACILFGPGMARAGIVQGAIPWAPAAGAPPATVLPGSWHFFTPREGRAMEALVDRLIPPDPGTPGGKDVGCAVYIDRQLAAAFGRWEGHYLAGPVRRGTKEQGPQGTLDPATQYRRALAALDAHCEAAFGGRTFADLDDADKDRAVAALESGEVRAGPLDTKAFFPVLIKNVREGFFADPIYGGNRDMAGWKMIGFPGARYDYSDWIERHNERYPLPPVSIAGAPSWSPN